MKSTLRHTLAFLALGLILCAAPTGRMHPDSNLLTKVPNAPPLAGAKVQSEPSAYLEQLRLAILGEEHAWLKTYGYADIERRLRVTPYPERKYANHAEDDLLPPPLATVPKLDGQPGDPAWQGASRGVVRVAGIAGWQEGPLVEQPVEAGVCGSDLCLAVTANRFLSPHLALVGVVNQSARGLIVLAGDGL